MRERERMREMYVSTFDSYFTKCKKEERLLRNFFIHISAKRIYIYIHMSKPWFMFNKGFVYDVIRREKDW